MFHALRKTAGVRCFPEKGEIWSPQWITGDSWIWFCLKIGRLPQFHSKLYLENSIFTSRLALRKQGFMVLRKGPRGMSAGGLRFLG